MRKTTTWLLVILGLVLIAAILYNANRDRRPVLQSQPAAEPPRAAAPPQPIAPLSEPGVRYPITEKPEETPLPPLSGSDAVVGKAAAALWGEKAIEQLFNIKDFVRRIVATIDNLPREKVALRLMPVKPARGQFMVTPAEEGYRISPENAARYAPYVRLAEAIDTQRLVALYARYYPLFQEAYLELGYPKGYFNDRLVEVIDHLLATPAVEEPVKLVQPKVLYKFADPDLEAQSAGRKILIRMGPDNAARIKAKLREIRAALTSNAPSPPRTE